MKQKINTLLIKVTFLLSAFCGCFTPAFAQNGLLLTGGIEWGCGMNCFQFEHYNYTVPDGPRVDVKELSRDVRMTGSLSLYGGIATGERWASELHLGYRGITAGRLIYTASLRETFYQKGMSEDSFMLFAEALTGFGETLRSRPDLGGGLGLGYRIKLSRSFYFNTHLSLETVLDHPSEIVDSYSSKTVSNSSIRRSNAVYPTVRAGISLCYR